MAFVAEGDTDPRLNERVKAAVQAELGHGGLTVMHGRDGTPDMDIRLEIRVSAAVYFSCTGMCPDGRKRWHGGGHGGDPDEFHREGDFPLVMAGKAVQALLHSPALAEFAEKKNPHPVAVRHEPRSASVETKPSPETVASAKEHFNQGTRHHELGHYQEALGEFEAAYMAVPDPVFLFNIAQCHRKMGHDKEAIGFYKSYLRTAPNAPNRATCRSGFRN
jgi:hypothetical protein